MKKKKEENKEHCNICGNLDAVPDYTCDLCGNEMCADCAKEVEEGWACPECCEL